MEQDQEMIDQGYLDGQRSFDNLWQGIHKSFDWDKVYVVMKALDWRWHFGNELYGIPTKDTIIIKAHELMQEVYNNKKGMVSTGGFAAGWDDGHIWLTFQVSEAHSSDN